MTTSREHLEKFSREDLIGTIQALEDSLAEAAKGLMTEGSAQEFAVLKNKFEKLEKSEEWFKSQTIHYGERAIYFSARLHRIPRLFRWWYGC